MSIILKRDAAPEGLRTGGERSGTQEWSAQEGPRNTELFWLRGTSVPEAGLERPKDQRTFGPRSRVDRSGSSQEGAVRWKATPELVSQDREAGTKPFYGAGPGRPNTGISFARRSGGWQQCRPPFLFWAWQQCRPLIFLGSSIGSISLASSFGCLCSGLLALGQARGARCICAHFDAVRVAREPARSRASGVPPGRLFLLNFALALAD